MRLTVQFSALIVQTSRPPPAIEMLTISNRDDKHLSVEIDHARADALLAALGEQLSALGAEYELAVIGGSGLLMLDLVTRTTRDVDVVALVDDGHLARPTPLPAALREARDRVARDFQVDEDWLNAAPASLLDFGLPDGFMARVESRPYGPALTVHFASRFDQIHFKLYAVADQGLGKHEADLRALEPSAEELLAAARWTVTHDPSPGFREELLGALAHFGVEDVDLEP